MTTDQKLCEILLHRLYYTQVRSSKERGHNPPDYNKNELFNYFINNQDFLNIYNSRKDSGFLPNKIPSIDRINPLIGYNFNNIQIMTWEENNQKGKEEKKKKIYIDGVWTVLYDIEGIHIKNGTSVLYNKMSDITKSTGIDLGTISKALSGKRKSAGGYLWRYKKHLYNAILDLLIFLIIIYLSLIK